MNRFCKNQHLCFLMRLFSKKKSYLTDLYSKISNQQTYRKRINKLRRQWLLKGRRCFHNTTLTLRSITTTLASVSNRRNVRSIIIARRLIKRIGVIGCSAIHVLKRWNCCWMWARWWGWYFGRNNNAIIFHSLLILCKRQNEWFSESIECKPIYLSKPFWNRDQDLLWKAGKF